MGKEEGPKCSPTLQRAQRKLLTEMDVVAYSGSRATIVPIIMQF